MSEKESNLGSTAGIVAGIVKEVPLYKDALQPAALQVGKSLELVAKSINIALAPIKGLVWGYEQIESWLTERLSVKLAGVPEEHIISPLPNIAVPALEALRYTAYDGQLRELYANLLASAMNRDTAAQTHPAYVEVLKNISAAEATLLQSFSALYHYPVIHIRGRSKNGGLTLYKRFHSLLPGSQPAGIDNLLRLGILESPPGELLADGDVYIPLETDHHLEPLLETIMARNDKIEFERGMLRLTSFGGQFIMRVIN